MLSKEQEIQKFNRWYKSLEEGSYLQGIFKGMSGEVEQQIRNDFAVPVIETLEQARIDRGRELDEANNLVKVLEKRNRDLKWKMENGGRKASSTKKALRKVVRDLTRWLEDSKSQLHEDRANLVAKSSLIYDYQQEVERLQAEVKRQAKVIIQRNLDEIKGR